MTRVMWESSCCYAALESYKDTECPECGLPCEAQPTDIEPPEIVPAWDFNDIVRDRAAHHERKDKELGQ